jgi:biopolymer transport protein ExbD
MGMKKRNKVSAEFSMSSLTDIIFLLLIFFMLTSSMIVPNALNLQLPGRKSSTPKTNSTPNIVQIESNGNYFYNGQRISLSNVEGQMRDLKRAKGDNATVTIRPSGQASNDAVVAILDIAFRYKIASVLDEPQ